MSEPNDTSPAAPTESEAPDAAPDETSAPSETTNRDAKDPDDEATVIEPPDPGFVAPAD